MCTPTPSLQHASHYRSCAVFHQSRWIDPQEAFISNHTQDFPAPRIGHYSRRGQLYQACPANPRRVTLTSLSSEGPQSPYKWFTLLHLPLFLCPLLTPAKAWALWTSCPVQTRSFATVDTYGMREDVVGVASSPLPLQIRGGGDVSPLRMLLLQSSLTTHYLYFYVLRLWPSHGGQRRLSCVLSNGLGGWCGRVNPRVRALTAIFVETAWAGPVSAPLTPFPATLARVE